MQKVLILHPDGTKEYTEMDIPEPTPDQELWYSSDDLLSALLGVKNSKNSYS